jgi:hypothetical protein
VEPPKVLTSSRAGRSWCSASIGRATGNHRAARPPGDDVYRAPFSQGAPPRERTIAPCAT